MKIYIIPAWYPQDENDITACFFREQAHALAYGDVNTLVDCMRDTYQRRWSHSEIEKYCRDKFSQSAICKQIEAVYNMQLSVR